MHFIRSLILARLLSPYDFGCIGTLTIFITVFQIFVKIGFDSAIFVYLILAVAFRLQVLHDIREVAEIFFEKRKR